MAKQAAKPELAGISLAPILLEGLATAEHKKQWGGIEYVEHLKGDGAVIFEHACKLGLEGTVSKRIELTIWRAVEELDKGRTGGGRGTVFQRSLKLEWREAHIGEQP